MKSTFSLNMHTNKGTINTVSNPIRTVSKSIRMIFGALVVAAALAFSLVAVGCASGSVEVNSSDNAEENTPTMSQYMVDLNVSANKLQTALTEFSNAVSSNDTYMMSLKADEAYAVMDEMDAIECPPDLEDVKAKYKEATSELRTALADYLALYIDIDAAQTSAQFNYDDYNTRLEEIQKHYDEGLNLLEEADDMVAKVSSSAGNTGNGPSSSSSSSSSSAGASN